MKKALFAAFASVAMLGASCSCSVKDFAPVVLDSASYACSYTDASFLDAPKAEISTLEDLSDLYGQYSFRYGYLSDNLYENKLGVQDYYMCAGYIYDGGGVSDSGLSGQPKWIDFNFSANTTYTISFDVRGGNTADTLVIGMHHSGDTYERHFGYDSYNDSSFTRVSISFAAESASDRFFIGVYNYGGYIYVKTQTIMIQKGSVSSTPAYEPYGLGMSYDTPISGIGSAAYVVASNGYPTDRVVYTDNTAYPEMANFSINFMSLHFDLSNDVLGVFHNAVLDALSRATTRNVGELGYDDDASPYEVSWVVENPYDAYIEFEVSSPLPERFKDTIVDGLEYIQYELKDASDTKSGYLYPGNALWGAMDDYLISGLLDVQGFKFYLASEYGSELTGDLSMQLHFYYGLNGKDLNFSPIYVDNRSYGAVTDLDLMPLVSAGAVINLGNQWDCFVLNMNTTFAGLAISYGGEFATIGDETYYRDLRIFTPRNESANKLRYVGVLSSYARGYADGVASRDGEVDDLTEQILGLQEDLSQYEGKTYNQIYNLGYQAGLDEENQGARTFNSLFGNILTAPLTILNGVSDISFFGMPILTAILSLLMVALALFLFKRFK